MKYKYISFFIIFFSLSCVQEGNIKVKTNIINKPVYSSKGFALIYKSMFYKNKLIKKKINNREFVILHSFLKPKSYVKIFNPRNGKNVVAMVKYKTEFSKIYNSVITKRIAETIDLDPNDPYVEIVEINQNIKFIAKKAKTFDEEKNVANTAPVDDINIKNISLNKEKIQLKKTNKYLIKIVNFYYLESAKSLKKKLISELNFTNINIEQVSTNNYRVFCGPFNSFDDIKQSYFAIINLGFEQLEIIKIN